MNSDQVAIINHWVFPTPEGVAPDSAADSADTLTLTRQRISSFRMSRCSVDGVHTHTSSGYKFTTKNILSLQLASQFFAVINLKPTKGTAFFRD